MQDTLRRMWYNTRFRWTAFLPIGFIVVGSFCRIGCERRLGVALVVDQIAAEILASGDLVWVLPGIVGRHDRARLVYPDREFVDPKVRASIDFIASRVDANRNRREQTPS